MKRAHLAARIGVSPQYVGKLLSGTENLSFKSVANIEEKLGISYLIISFVTMLIYTVTKLMVYWCTN